MLERAHKGIDHKMSPKHLERYVQEFAGRHTIRDIDTLIQMEMVVQGLEGKRLTIKRDDLVTEREITREHISNNQNARGLLGKRNIKPELLPPEEDVKKVERRLTTEEKRLPKNVDPLGGIDNLNQ